jgi:uncharacterized protein (DUF433 family)
MQGHATIVNKYSTRESLMNYHDIITLEPGKRGGKPCIRGLRITVYDVLDYLAAGMTPEQIIEDFDYRSRYSRMPGLRC